MKHFNLLTPKNRFALVLLAQFAYLPLTAAAPATSDAPSTTELTSTTAVLSGVAPDGGSGHAVSSEHAADDLSPTVRRSIEQRIEANHLLLQQQTRAPAAAVSTGHVLFSWPLSSTLQDPGYHDVSNFVDHNPAYPNQLLDYFGGSRTYDTTAGYNHAGTDFSLWPFPWNKMDGKQVAIVAAATGKIIDKKDGNSDRNCSMSSPDTPNYVILSHADGSHSWYLHMKNGTPIKRAIGAGVKVGEVIGYVGSSGVSTGPHLHFEVHDKANNLIDPWLGSFNPSTTTSWWQAQKPYIDAAINKLTTGTAAPNVPSCANETSNESHVFKLGDPIYFTSYYRDQDANQVSNFAILRPDNSVYSQWSNTTSSYASGSYWYWWFNMPSTPAPGKWTFQVQLNNKTYNQTFELCAAVRPSAVQALTPASGALVKSVSTLKWSATCGNTYSVIIREGSNTGVIVNSIQNTFNNNFTTKALTVGKTYFWQVTANNKWGLAKSTWRSFTVQ